MAEELRTSRQWVHSCRVRNPKQNKDFVAVKEKLVTINKDNEVVKAEDNISFIEKPQRRIWITKPAFRTHENKKESEDINKLDCFHVLDGDLMFELKKLLGLGHIRGYVPYKRLMSSPYVYGADTSIEALIRTSYEKNQTHQINHITTGAYDHEQSMLGCDRINCITVVLGDDCYTAVLADFLGNNEDENGKKFTVDLPRINEFSHEVLQPYIKEHNFKLNIEIFRTELEMFEYIFAAIHKHKTDFIGIWNMDYDIPSLAERIQINGRHISDMLHHPGIAQKYKHFWYQKDHRKVAHIVDKWHWTHNVGYSQWIDAMLVYARIRKIQTKEPSYSLDAISSKEIGQGKLHFGPESEDHRFMQSKRFLEYIAYNIADAILIQLIFRKTNDVETLIGLTGISPLSDFSKQLNMLRDQLYNYYLDHGRVLGCCGTDNKEPHAEFIKKVGGTVLPPFLVGGTGLRAIKGNRRIETKAFGYVFDEDISAVYPTTKAIFNISKDTKQSTAIGIDGNDDIAIMEKFYGGATMPIENAHMLGTDFLGLPSYTEWDDIFNEHIKKQGNKLPASLN